MKRDRTLLGAVCLVVSGTVFGCVGNSTFTAFKETEEARWDSLYVYLSDTTDKAHLGKWLLDVGKDVCELEQNVPDLPPGSKRLCPNGPGGPGDQSSPPPPPPKP
jgi:hypothetical protein